MPTIDVIRRGLDNLEFRLARSTLAEAVSWVAKSLPTRPIVPVTAGLLLSGVGNKLVLSGFDFEISTETQVDADIISPGDTLVSGRLLSDIVQALPERPVEFCVDGSRLALTCGSAKFSLPLMVVEDYPTLPVLPEETGSLPADLFAEAVSQVAIAAGQDDALPALTGIYIDISGTKMTLAATDRWRLAIRELTWSPATPDIEITALVPAKAIVDVAKAGKTGGEVHLSLGSGDGECTLLGISGDGRRSTTSLLDAEFPKFSQLLPTEHTAVAIASVAELTEAIKLVALVAERGTQVRMEFKQNAVKLFAGTDDVGRAEEVQGIDFTGEPLTISFNPAFLLDGLSSLHSEQVSFGFTGPGKAALLRPVSDDDDDYQYLLMPVRIPSNQNR